MTNNNVQDPRKLPPLFDKVETVKDDKKNQVLFLKIKLNPTLQRIVYEQIYKQHAKEAEMKGFRKGNVPREILEPQIYQQVVHEMISTLLLGLPTELAKQIPQLLGEDRVVVGDPVVENLRFQMVEAPIEIDVRVYWAPTPNLPDLKKYKLTEEIKVEVVDKEIDDALQTLFEDWRKRVDKRKAAEFLKPNDKWVQELGINNVKTLKDLREHLRKVVAEQKKASILIKKYEETLHKIFHDLQISIPPSLLKEKVERARKEVEEQMQKLGVTFKDYLKANNINEKQFEEQIEHQVVDEIKHRVFWNLYIKAKGINVDPQNDKLYIEKAAYDYAASGKAQVTTLELLTRALLIKAEETLLKDLGFISGQTQKETPQQTPATEKSQNKPSILIPEDAKI